MVEAQPRSTPVATGTRGLGDRGSERPLMERLRRLFIARDRVGIKPLFYCAAGSRLYYASEIKSLLCAPNVSNALDVEAIDHFLAFLYTPEGQELIAQNFDRPIDPAVGQKHASTFPPIKLFTVDAIAKDWTDAYDKFIGDGKIYDSIYQQGR